MSLRPLVEGRYVDFTPVGEGGMGIVYWAVDSDLKRQVAFKIVRPPRESAASDITPPVPFAIKAPGDESNVSEAYDHLTARFLQEAWVTGGMEHPGIVPVYELGRTEAGVPYYTMKFVRGNRTLKAAIEETRDKPIDERLRLLDPFLKICDTMRYAHSRGVIHRDLKPDNVALGEFGEVVVLDWGLAKLAEEGQSQLSRWQGEVHAFRDEGRLETMPSAVGTPGYMAPEAARGLTDVLDERCDVYSLGVILFELLTGQLPFRCDNFRDYQDQLAKDAAPDAQSVRGDVPAGLSAICASALCRELGNRTATVQALADAVLAWQDRRLREREIEVLFGEAESGLRASASMQGEALSSQADRVAVACQRVLELDPEHTGAKQALQDAEAARERGIREREQVARSKTLRKAVAVGLALAAIGAGVAAWMLDQRRQEAEKARTAAATARARAIADRERAEDVMGFMVGDLQESLQAIGRVDVLARLGREARAYFEKIPEGDVTPLSLRNGTRALLNLGDVHNELGALPAAMQTFEAARKIAERLPADAEGGALRDEVRARVAYVFIKQGFYRKALALLEPVAKRLEGGDGSGAARRRLLAETHGLLGLGHTGNLDVDGAKPHFQKALAAARALAREEPDNARTQMALVRYVLSQRRTRLLDGKADSLKALADEAQPIVNSWRAKNAKDVRWERLEADVEITRAEHAKWSQDDNEAAGARYKKALATFERLHALDPLNATYLSTIGFLEGRLGEVRKAANDQSGALAHWKRSYEIQEQLVSKDPTNATWLHRMVNLADPMNLVGRGAGESRATLQAYRDAAVRHAQRLVEVDKDNPLARHLLTYALFRQASFLPDARARAQYDDVIRRCEELTRVSPRAGLELGVLAFWAAGESARRSEDDVGPTLFRRVLALLDALKPDDLGTTQLSQLVSARLDARAQLAGRLESKAERRAWLVEDRAFLERHRADMLKGHVNGAMEQLAKRAKALEEGGD